MVQAQLDLGKAGLFSPLPLGTVTFLFTDIDERVAALLTKRAQMSEDEAMEEALLV